jgi:salicylate hydroxylase/6-hydroxynicotinate 3-monooxygenase
MIAGRAMKKDSSVVIIGAGIGGLAAAAALRRVGVDAVVYEQAEKFTRIGAGIQQSPNAMKVHRGLGIEARLRDTAFAPATSLNRDAETGAVTNEHPLGRDVEARYGAPYLTLHRGDLHAALATIVPSDCIHMGRRLVRIAPDGAGVVLGFADGSEVAADAVIGADGVHSLVRDHVQGHSQDHADVSDRARFTGRVAYRTTFPAARLRGVDVGASRTKWWGADRHIVIYWVTAARDEVYFVTSQPERADWITQESWSAKGDVGELRAAFARFHPDVQAVLAAAPEVHKWGIFERGLAPGHRGAARRRLPPDDALHGVGRRHGAGRRRRPVALFRGAGGRAPRADLRCLRGDPQAARLAGADRIEPEYLDAQRDRSGLALWLRCLDRAARGRGGGVKRRDNMATRQTGSQQGAHEP